MDEQLIQKLEQLTMQALPASDQENYCNYVLRYTNGFTKRANSIYPCFSSLSQVDNILSFAENWYKARNHPALFKITEHPVALELDKLLDERQYEKIDLTHVELLAYTNYEAQYVFADVHLTNDFDAAWFEAVCTYNEIYGRDMTVFAELLKKITAHTAYVSVIDHGEIIACGLGVLEGDYFGLYDIVTAPAHRNRGIGKDLLHYLLQWGAEQGAKYAYLQVLASNKPAIHLYRKLGFERAYQYWYRMEPSN